MLSRRIVFRSVTGSWQPITPLAFKFQLQCKANYNLFPNFSAPPYPNASEPGNGVMSRSHHFDANKAILLYFRSSSESVVVIFANYSSMRRYYRAYTSRLCMLTYRLYVLSNPVTPLRVISGCKINNFFFYLQIPVDDFKIKIQQPVSLPFTFAYKANPIKIQIIFYFSFSLSL